MSHHNEEFDEPGPSVVGEAIGTLVALGGSGALLINYWDAYGFLAPTAPQLRHIVAYWVLALLMVAGVAWTFVSAQRREARAIAYVWHSLVAILSIAAIATLIVPKVTFQEPLPVENNVNYDPCYSGGDPCG